VRTGWTVERRDAKRDEVVACSKSSLPELALHEMR
jgi:hypothetical protein